MSIRTNPDSVPASLDAAVAAADREGKSGYYRDSDGQFVDPIIVQQFVIYRGFQRISETDGFNIWTVVEPRVLVEGDTVAENFERVGNAFTDVTEDVAQEVADQIEAMGHDLEDSVDEQ